MKISFKPHHFPLKMTQVIGSITLLLVTLICQLNTESWSPYTNFDRTAIIAGEYWRLITGHFFHTNLAHWLLNSAGVVMLWLLHGQFYTIKQFSIIYLFLAISTSLLILAFSPHLILYVGLSGLLHGVLVFGGLRDLQQGEKTGYILLLGLVLKIIYEQLFGASAEVSNLIQANVAIDAHMWGALSGVIYSLLYFLINGRRARKH